MKLSLASFSINSSPFQAAWSILSISFPLYFFSSVHAGKWYSYYYLRSLLAFWLFITISLEVLIWLLIINSLLYLYLIHAFILIAFVKAIFR